MLNYILVLFNVGNPDGCQLPQRTLWLQRSCLRIWRLKLRCRLLDSASIFRYPKINVRMLNYILVLSNVGNPDGCQLPQRTLWLQRSWPRPWRLKLRCRFLDAASNFP